MPRKLMAAALALIMTACAHVTPKSDASSTARTETAEQQRAAEAVAAQADRPDIKEQVHAICQRPQPERWELAKALLASNQVLAGCAFDKDHPVPKDPNRGALVIIPN